MSTPSPVRTGIEAQGDSEYELDVGAVAAGGGGPRRRRPGGLRPPRPPW